MVSSLQSTMNSVATHAPATEITARQYEKLYRENCDRIYCMAFWMTDNELEAEQLSANTFLRVFAGAERPTVEQIDRAFIAELRDRITVGTLALNCAVSPNAERVYGRVKRVVLERAVVQLPATERLIFLMHSVENYDHPKIARLLGIGEEESRLGLHQARLQIRKLIAGNQ